MAESHIGYPWNSFVKQILLATIPGIPTPNVKYYLASFAEWVVLRSVLADGIKFSEKNALEKLFALSHYSNILVFGLSFSYHPSHCLHLVETSSECIEKKSHKTHNNNRRTIATFLDGDDDDYNNDNKEQVVASAVRVATTDARRIRDGHR